MSQDRAFIPAADAHTVGIYGACNLMLGRTWGV